jgi:peptidoglycan/xylan/chitin deacetylase (PgdA/CDA1 family)
MVLHSARAKRAISRGFLALAQPRAADWKKAMLSPLATDVSLALGAAAAVGLAAGGFQYAALWPASQIFGRALVAPARPGELALTFDDGPNPACTPRLLDLLGQYGVKGTFFLIGSFAEHEPQLTKRIAEAGHLIGNHSWSHPNLSLCAPARIRDELRRTTETLEQLIGKPVRYFRPPFGARRPYVFRTARGMGMTPVLWNAMTSDWEEKSPDRIAERLSAKIGASQRRGHAANIVLHDGSHHGLNADRGPSLGAVGRLLGRYAGTHRFVTLDAWSRGA